MSFGRGAYNDKVRLLLGKHPGEVLIDFGASKLRTDFPQGFLAYIAKAYNPGSMSQSPEYGDVLFSCDLAATGNDDLEHRFLQRLLTSHQPQISVRFLHRAT